MQLVAGEAFPYFSPRVLGASFEEILDNEIIQAPSNLTCQWFHSPYDADLLVWKDTMGGYVRLHFCVAGLTLDWDLVNGTQTGFILEDPDEELSHSIFGKVQYDTEVSQTTRFFLLQVLQEIAIIGVEQREEIYQQFLVAPVPTKRTSAFQGVIGLLRKFLSQKS